MLILRQKLVFEKELNSEWTSQMIKPAAAHYWLECLKQGCNKEVTERFEREFQNGTVKPKEVAKRFELDSLKDPSVLDCKAVKLRGTIEEYNINTLSAVYEDSGDFNGIGIVQNFVSFKKKKIVWASRPVYCRIQMHAIERLTQRAGATVEDCKKALFLAARTSQVFNGAHWVGFSSQIPLILPFQDGLFLGQSDLKPCPAFTTRWEFGLKGVSKKELPPPPQTSVLLGTPREMRIRTFIGGEAGLTKTKKQVHAQLNGFFKKYKGVLEGFGDKLLFDFDLHDFAHAISLDMQDVFLNIANELQIKTELDNCLPADPIKRAFQNKDEEIQFRKMLDEYWLLLETPEFKQFLESSSNHVR